MHYLTSEYATSNFAKYNNEDSFFAHYCEKMHAKELVKPYVKPYNFNKYNSGDGGVGKEGSSTRQLSCLLANRSMAAAFAVEVGRCLVLTSLYKHTRSHSTIVSTHPLPLYQHTL